MTADPTTPTHGFPSRSRWPAAGTPEEDLLGGSLQRRGQQQHKREADPPVLPRMELRDALRGERQPQHAVEHHEGHHERDQQVAPPHTGLDRRQPTRPHAVHETHDQDRHRDQQRKRQLTRSRTLRKLVGRSDLLVLRPVATPEEVRDDQHQPREQRNEQCEGTEPHEDAEDRLEGARSRVPQRERVAHARRRIDRIAEGDQPGGFAHSSATGLARVPSPVMETFTSSPGCMAPTPAGVPVRMTSPGRRVIEAVM